MANYTITTTADEDQVIGFLVDQQNAERAASGRPPISAQDLVAGNVRRLLAEHAEAARRDHHNRVINAYEAATPAKRNAARAALGLNP